MNGQTMRVKIFGNVTTTTASLISSVLETKHMKHTAEMKIILGADNDK